MIVLMDARLARRIAGQIKASTPKPSAERPNLETVNVTWTPKGRNGIPSVRFTTTDSYRLITFEVDELIGADYAGTPDGLGRVDVEGGDGEINLVSPALRKALEAAANHATVQSLHSVVALVVADGCARVLARHPDQGEIEAGVVPEREAFRFPTWDSLIPDGEPSAEKVAYNPAYLGDMLAAFVAGGLPITHDAPIRFEPHGLGATALRPNARNDGWLGLLMPVRI